jgi:hypothetical protein
MLPDGRIQELASGIGRATSLEQQNLIRRTACGLKISTATEKSI